MPYIDYAEWFRREQKRRQQQQPVGVPPQSQVQTQTQTQTQPITQAQTQTQMPTWSSSGAGIGPNTGYKSPRFGQIDQEIGQLYKDVGVGAVKGYIAGGQLGALANATAAAIPAYTRAGRRAWDAAKEGDREGFTRSLAPVNPLMYLQAKMGGESLNEKVLGLPSWTDPTKLLVKGIHKLFGGTAPNIEKQRWERLKSYYGFDLPKPEWVDTKDAALKAQNKNLAKDFVGYDESGKWVNNKFANSGKDTDLKAQDIQEFATNLETFGEEYTALPTEKKLQMMDIALRNGLVTEQKGTVDINWTPETYQEAANILYNDPSVQKWQSEQPQRYEFATYQAPARYRAPGARK